MYTFFNQVSQTLKNIFQPIFQNKPQRKISGKGFKNIKTKLTEFITNTIKKARDNIAG